VATGRFRSHGATAAAGARPNLVTALLSALIPLLLLVGGIYLLMRLYQ